MHNRSIAPMFITFSLVACITVPELQNQFGNVVSSVMPVVMILSNKDDDDQNHKRRQ